ncbi:MAG: hypothetical protein K0R15_333 [Clostridiales bacterium]|jgi:hypothetical protein|nr:hypothetical protein [Clostridiales bacterium]
MNYNKALSSIFKFPLPIFNAKFDVCKTPFMETGE